MQPSETSASTNEIQLSAIEQALDCIDRLNKIEVGDLVLMDGTTRIDIGPQLARAWTFVGLNTADFIRMRAWEDPTRMELLNEKDW